MGVESGLKGVLPQLFGQDLHFFIFAALVVIMKSTEEALRAAISQTLGALQLGVKGHPFHLSLVFLLLELLDFSLFTLLQFHTPLVYLLKYHLQLLLRRDSLPHFRLRGPLSRSLVEIRFGMMWLQFFLSLSNLMQLLFLFDAPLQQLFNHERLFCLVSCGMGVATTRLVEDIGFRGVQSVAGGFRQLEYSLCFCPMSIYYLLVLLPLAYLSPLVNVESLLLPSTAPPLLPTSRLPLLLESDSGVSLLSKEILPHRPD